MKVDRSRLLRSPEINMLVQFTPFNHIIKPPKPDPLGNEEYKMYEKMLNKMFADTQNKVDPIKVVLSNTKEKPVDDVHDYPLDIGP